MTAVLQVRQQAIAAEQLVPLLKNYQLLPQLLREIIIDQAIATITCTAEEQEAAYQAFHAKHQLTSEIALQAWLKQHYMTRKELMAQIERGLKLEKFKQAMWGRQLESYFLKRKADLDQVIFSMIRTQDVGTAQELFFRLQTGEQSFAELAPHYSEGQEASTQGIVGPVAVSQLHAGLRQLLSVLRVGQLWTPVRIDKYLAIVRLEKRIPAQLDDAMRQKLLHELFNRWLQEQLDAVVHPQPEQESVA